MDIKDNLCNGRYIYVQELPLRFNADMVRSCGALSPWTDMCGYTAHGGFGPQLVGGAVQETGWYDTDVHALDVVFHDRMRRYEGLTDDPFLAFAVYVPFYAGVDVARHLWGYNVSTRDALALELADLARPAARVEGRGRPQPLLRNRAHHVGLPAGGAPSSSSSAVQNMTALVVEASDPGTSTTAFHPVDDDDVFLWQERARGLHRPYLFAYAGTTDDGKSIYNQPPRRAVRGVAQLLAAGVRQQGPRRRRHVRLRGQLHPPLPRLHVLPSTPCSPAAYPGVLPPRHGERAVYPWHLPKNHADYSVYIPEDEVWRNVSVAETLRRIPPEMVKTMREDAVRLIPTVIYTDPSTRLFTSMMDAFDVAVAAVIDKVAKVRKGGGAEEEKLDMYSWKYPLLKEGQEAEDPHEWDALFTFS
jgi:xyloglucan galactosyltransferase MUR3